LHEHRDILAVMAVLAGISDGSPIPPVAEIRADDVGARPHLLSDIVGLVLQPMWVAGPAGRQDGIANFLSVERQFVQTVAGRIDSGLRHFAGDLKLSSK